TAAVPAAPLPAQQPAPTPAPREATATSLPGPPSGLPRVLGRMIGRQDTVGEVLARLAAHRFVTLVGPGGIGKTTVAIAAAHAARPDSANAVVSVDLGAIGDPALVASVVAAALGVAVQSADALPTLLNFLRRRRVLLVLDNCEHVIDAVAGLAEPIFRDAPEV